MKILVEEMPASSERCPFSTQEVLHDGYGCVIDVSMDTDKRYCKITRERCDLAKNYGLTCSGLKVW